jgi:hypothetical protein
MDKYSVEIVRKQFISGEIQPGTILSKVLSDLPSDDIEALRRKAAEGMLGLELEKLAQLNRFQASSVEIREFIDVIKELESQTRQGFPSRYTAVGEFNTASGKTTITAKKGCFIATAVYNDYNHPIVIELREFRDEFLENHLFGNIFIKVYYFLSPSIASIIAKSSLLKILIKKILLLPLISIIRNIKSKNI